MESPEFLAKLRLAFLELVDARDPVWCYYDDGVALSATDVTRKRRTAELLAQLAVAGGLTTDYDNTADGAKALLAFAREGAPENAVEEVVRRTGPADPPMRARVVVSPAVVDVCSVAARYCERLATRALAERAANVPTGDSASAPARRTQRVAVREPFVFAQEGDEWLTRFDGVERWVKHKRGFELLRGLLRVPGRSVPAYLLLGRDEPELAGGAMLDEQAKQQYRGEITRLAHAEDAEQDRGRKAELRAEREQIQRALAASKGRRGDRKVGSSHEAARKAAHAAIRRALAELKGIHPALHDHLRSAITTGARLQYGPPRDLPWRTDI